MAFELATWYATWNKRGLDNLVQGKVPLNYATRYNLAFGIFEACAKGYTLRLNRAYASQVIAEIRNQAPGVLIYAGTDSGVGTGLTETVHDNSENNNRSTANIVAYLKGQGLNGIAIDAEQEGWGDVPELVEQLGPSFKEAGLGIVVSSFRPHNGLYYYGEDAATKFNQHVDAIELQNYSSPDGLPKDVQTLIQAGFRGAILGGVRTENDPYGLQTPLSTITDSAKFALQNGLRGMFSWRLDNDYGPRGWDEVEDLDPTFMGAKTLYDTVQEYAVLALRGLPRT